MDSEKNEDRFKVKVTKTTLIQARGTLVWEENGVLHRDACHLPKLNLWRDLFPPELEQKLLGAEAGEKIEMTFPAGNLIPDHDPAKIFKVYSGQFDFNEEDPFIEPKLGLFYRLGCLTGMSGVFRSDLRPFRIIDQDANQIWIDCNPPLAGRDLMLELDLETISASQQERGGQCIDLASKLSEGGPGMQAGLNGLKTEFNSGKSYFREDEDNDLNFYQKPRLLPHLDIGARAELEGLYARLLTKSNRILDLMSSWQSHLPQNLETSTVVGLGMNREELRLNPKLDQNLVHDLNQDPELPFEDQTFDTVLCSLSIEYLLEPVKMLEEARRILVPGGLLLISFSNRWFPPKVIRIWTELQEFERTGLVLQWLKDASGFHTLETFSLRELPRPEDDRYRKLSPFSDPIYAVWAYKA